MDLRAIKDSVLSRFVPFLAWLPELKNKDTLRADIIAGITVAMILIPQSMAYASLAGLEPYYGLYAAFLPPLVAALFGSSRQLATGPVAVVSLLTASALGPIIGTDDPMTYAYYAILLALLVGLFQLSLGLLRLGVILNFLSHPVVLGFTNAAAIIIATSQLNKVFGVEVEKAADGYHYQFVWDTLVATTKYIHWPTLFMAILAFAIMIIAKRKNPKLPNVLFAVALTTILSSFINFHGENQNVTVSNIKAPEITENIKTYIKNDGLIKKLKVRLKASQKRQAQMELEFAKNHSALRVQRNKTIDTKSEISKLVETNASLMRYIKLLNFGILKEPNSDEAKYYLDPDGESSKYESNGWHIKEIVDSDKGIQITMISGGNVVGTVPQGLPIFKVPGANIEGFSWGLILSLLPMAMVISLIGFMEAISIAKTMASKTRQRLDANQELVGQGLANIGGSLFQSYPVSGSFSRSAVNISTGAVTGFSSIVTSIIVALTLLFFTPLLYSLPQATLAAVIMMAVIGLVNVKSIKHAWLANKHDGIVTIVTFVLTLTYAPHLEMGIMFGIALSLSLFLYRTMTPRLVFLAKHADGTMREAKAYNLGICKEIAMLRYEGSLYFANTSYLEDKVQKVVARAPNLKFLIIDGVSINQVDATGEEMLREICRRLEDIDIEVLFTRFKKPILDMLERTHFISDHGREYFYRKPELALEFAWAQLEENHKDTCPLNAYIDPNIDQKKES